MRKFFGISSVLLLFSAFAAAQVPTSGNVFVGYSYFNADLTSTGAGRHNTNGWEGSFEGKVFPFIGIVADFSDHYGSGLPIACPVVPVGGGGIGGGCPLNSGFNERNILFGPRVSMSVGKFRPFAEALFGAGHINLDSGGTDTSFATAIGGGLDVKIIRPVAWRFQGDYVQTRFFDGTQNNVRISTGIVLRF
jgi:hypothetical protein